MLEIVHARCQEGSERFYPAHELAQSPLPVKFALTYMRAHAYLDAYSLYKDIDGNADACSQHHAAARHSCETETAFLCGAPWKA